MRSPSGITVAAELAGRHRRRGAGLVHLVTAVPWSDCQRKRGRWGWVIVLPWTRWSRRPAIPGNCVGDQGLVKTLAEVSAPAKHHQVQAEVKPTPTTTVAPSVAQVVIGLRPFGGLHDSFVTRCSASPRQRRALTHIAGAA